MGFGEGVWEIPESMDVCCEIIIKENEYLFCQSIWERTLTKTKQNKKKLCHFKQK